MLPPYGYTNRRETERRHLSTTYWAKGENIPELIALTLPRRERVGVRLTGRSKMTHSNLKIEVQPPYIHVVLPGTCLRAKYRKQDAPWLAPEEYGEDPEAEITFSEFRTLAWEVANEAARQLGWIRTYTSYMRRQKWPGAQSNPVLAKRASAPLSDSTV